MILVLYFAVVLTVPVTKPNDIGTRFLQNHGEVIFEETKPINANDFDTNNKRVAIVISGQTSRCLVGNYLKQYLLDANPNYQFDIYVDLTDSGDDVVSDAKGYQHIKDHFQHLPTNSIVIRTKPTLPEYPGTGSYKFPTRYVEWYEKKNMQHLYRANLQAMYTKFRLKETVKKVERDNNVQYYMYMWFREDQVFSNKFDLELVDMALKPHTIVAKDCMQWGGMNEKTFFMKRMVFEYWGNFIRNFYEEDYPTVAYGVVGTIDGCYNSEQCHKMYFQRLNFEVNRLGRYTLPMCDGIKQNEKVCFRNEYCDSCSVPIQDQEEKIEFCDVVQEPSELNKEEEKNLLTKLLIWKYVAVGLATLIGLVLLIVVGWKIWNSQCYNSAEETTALLHEDETDENMSHSL